MISCRSCVVEKEIVMHPYRSRHIVLLLTVLAMPLVGLAAAGHAENVWVTSNEYDRFHVVAADSASDSEKLAAREFLDHWQQVTEKEVAVSNHPIPSSGVNVWIGRDGVPPEYLNTVKLDGLGTDGFCIRTIKAEKGGPAHLLIVGGRERGTMYGVYQFLEDYLGIWFLAPSETYVPATAPASLPEIDVRYVPSILRRQMTYGTYGMQAYPEEQRTAFERHMRWSSYPDFGLFVHTIYEILPPDKYFPGHPEFYSELDGKRVAPVTTVDGTPTYIDTYDPKNRTD